MPHLIEKFKELKWEDSVKEQQVYIAGNLKAGIPTRVYGPHTMEDPKKHTIKSNNNGKVFHEDWHCIYIHKEE